MLSCKNYFFFRELKNTGCPVFINGLIHEEFHAKGADMEMNYNWYWVDSGQKLANLPNELWLISKDRLYSFDFRQAFNGYIVSERLLSLMDDFEVKNWEKCKLNIVNKKKEKISKINYFFLRKPKNKLSKDLIDIDLSKIDWRKNGEKRSIQNLKLINEIEDDIFLIDDLALSGTIFCSEIFKNNFCKQIWNGVELLSESQLELKKLWE